jgi:hypothetical protein
MNRNLFSCPESGELIDHGRTCVFKISPATPNFAPIEMIIKSQLGEHNIDLDFANGFDVKNLLKTVSLDVVNVACMQYRRQISR